MDSLSRRPRAVTSEDKKAWKRVRRLVRRSGVPISEADDVTQRAMMAVSLSKGSFAVPEGRSPEQAWWAWCAGVVHRVVRFHRREHTHGYRLLSKLGLEATGEPGPSAEEEAVRRVHLRAAFEVLAELSEEHRALFLAYEVEGRSVAELAAAMEVNANTAWNRLRRVREDVRAALARQVARQRTEAAMRRALARRR